MRPPEVHKTASISYRFASNCAGRPAASVSVIATIGDVGVVTGSADQGVDAAVGLFAVGRFF